MTPRHSNCGDRASISADEKVPISLDRDGILALDPPLYARALVIFGGRCGVWWLRWLKPGFRHCFAAVDDGRQWLTVDPLLHRLEIRATGLGSDFDLAAAYRAMNLVVVFVAPSAVRRRTVPIGLFTCVETVKRLLGFRAPWILTPRQLHRFLERRNFRAARAIHKANRTKQENILDIPTMAL